MFDRKRQVQVTPRPSRWRRDDSLRQVSVGKGAIALEIEAHHLEISALTVDVLRRRGPGGQDCREGRRYDEVPTPEA
jgi:protein subunit release factor B